VTQQEKEVTKWIGLYKNTMVICWLKPNIATGIEINLYICSLKLYVLIKIMILSMEF